MSLIQTIEDHYKNNRDQMVKLVSVRVQNTADAEDIVHDAYERAIKYSNSFDPDIKPFEAWFYRILINATKDYKAAQFGRYEIEEEEESIDCNLVHKETLLEIRKRIKLRPQKEQEVLTLFFFKGYKPTDIRHIVDYTHNNILQIIFLFRQNIKKIYADSRI